ncbi:MAG: polyprenol monophosphomannose synthase [bacterium]
MEKKKILSIGIPTYNEKENIYNIVLEIAKSVENQNIITIINIIDDNSPDGTADLIERSIPILKDNFSNLHINVIRREGKLGLASAHIRGFKEAFSQNADYIMEMDADLSHQPKYIPIFLDAIKDNDVIIGSRYIRGGGTLNWNIVRKTLSLGAGIYARTILGMRVQDMSAGYVMYRSEVLKKINIDKIKSNGYSFQIELKYRCFKFGFKIKEIPIIFPDRTKGVSKMNKIDTIIKTAFMVLKLKFDKSITN